MSEYHEYVGLRAEFKLKKVSIEIEGKSHRDSLRLALDPLKKINELDPENIMGLCLALVETINKSLENKAKIEAINKIIGER